MEISRLAGYGIPDHFVAAWAARQGGRLLPLQERAVRECGLFGDGNLLVCAPTSSGKTFIGEMAAVWTAVHRRKAVYLTPLRALAAEKHAQFQLCHGPLGLRVIVSTREHRDHDDDFGRGRYDIAVAVYEKFDQLLAWRPERLNEIGLVVADEMDLLADPERGAGVEVLLSRLRAAGCRVIGLSAVLENGDECAEWLDARLVRHERRSVELRYGVLHGGVYRYQTHNDRSEGAEEFPGASGATPWEIIFDGARALAESGESCLIFVKAKHEARRAAEALAARASLPPAARAVEALRALEPTRARDALMGTLSCGTAFHTTDLTREERAVVEEAFRSGEVRLITATGTLAVGLNLPAANVFPIPEKWVRHPRFDQPWRAPVGQGEYENMSGRAGRFGACGAFGRSILAAATPFDAESLWRCYVRGARAPLTPPLAAAPLGDHALRLLAGRACATPRALAEFFSGTLTARMGWGARPEERAAERVGEAVRACLERGMIRPGRPCGAEGTAADTVLEPTPLGRVAAAKGVGTETAALIAHWVEGARHRHWLDIDPILALALSPDGRMRFVGLTAREHAHGDYPDRLRRAAASQECQSDTPLNRMRGTRAAPPFEEMRAVKTALMLNDWINHWPVRDLEDEYETTAGQILAAADQTAWLADAAAAVADAINAPEAMAARLADLSLRLGRGVRTELLPLARGAGRVLTRREMLALHDAALHTPRALRLCGAELERLVPPAAAAALRRWAESAPDAAEQHAGRVIPEPVLVVDDAHPDRILLRGVPVPLQDRQFRLIRVLALHAGDCVPYEEIYSAVWGGLIVENNQLHFQKSCLLRRIGGVVAGAGEGLITAIPRRGFQLNLEPELVSCLCASAAGV